MDAEFSDGIVGLRRFRASDIPLLFAAVTESISELSSAMTWCQDGYSMEKSAAFVSSCHIRWHDGDEYTFVIFDAKDRRLLGSVGINHINRTHGFGNLGYWVRSTRTNRGFASAAVRLASRFALKDLGLHRLEMVVSAANVPSQRVAQKAGAKFEGLLRKRIMLQGKLHDAALYSLISSDLDPIGGGLQRQPRNSRRSGPPAKSEHNHLKSKKTESA